MNSTDLIQNGTLTLANGASWSIAASDRYGADIAATLAKSMRLKPSCSRPDQRLLIIKNGQPAEKTPYFLGSAVKAEPSIENYETTICQVPTAKDNDALALQLLQLSLVFCSQIETMGGVLVHGALAEKNGSGIILAGPGGVGKSTASKRLPPSWQSLSDDCTLIVRDQKGSYHAHPWPTWSTFMFGGKGDSWDVEHSVPLKGVFLLSQSNKDRAESIGKGQAVCMLNESAEQAWWMLTNEFDDRKRQYLNLQRFNNICKLMETTPAYRLHISKKGSFWTEIEQAIFST